MKKTTNLSSTLSVRDNDDCLQFIRQYGRQEHAVILLPEENALLGGRTVSAWMRPARYPVSVRIGQLDQAAAEEVFRHFEKGGDVKGVIQEISEDKETGLSLNVLILKY